MKSWLINIVPFLLWTCPTLQDEVPSCKTVALLNGFFIERKNRVDLGERTTYGCQTGFTTRQGLDRGEIQCLAQGWTPTPECIKTCRKPAEGNEQNVIFKTTKSVFFLEEKQVFECKDGYETIKKTTGDQTVCTLNGWNPKPECLPIQCEVSVPDHGSILPRKDLYLHGDVVQFSCLRRFTRVGPASAQCYHFGWSPPFPTCKVQVTPCKPPPNIKDGSIIDDIYDEYPHGEKVEYKCNIKFAMTGSRIIECMDGEWTSLPSCTVVEKTCGLPPSIPSGHPVSGDGKKYFHGETVTYECEENFVIVGTNPAKCLHGEWKLPVCAGFCPPPPQLPNAINAAELRNYKSGDKISFKCHENFLLQGPQEIACEDGKWQTPPRCIDQRCGDPPVIANGDVVNSIPRMYLSGESVEYRCHEGFEFRGLNFAVCENMEWSQVPACEGHPISTSANWRVKAGDLFHYLFASGPRSDVTCREPPAVANADLLNDTAAAYMTGHQVQYRCHEGFEITGLANVTCENGEWSESPKCEDARRRCGHPPPVENGDILYMPMEEYMSGATLQYKCQHFYVMNGSSEVRCVDGHWTATPVCLDAEGMCGRPPVIENGDILETTVSRYKPNSIVHYKCVSYYIMRGSPAVQCIFGHWTEAPTCIAACTATEEAMLSHKIQLRWESAKKLYSRSGQEMEFACRPGFLPAPSSPPFRLQCIEGHIEYPTCIKFCTTNERTMRNRNIQLTQISETGSKIPSGDVVEFTCRRGYREAPNSPPFHVQCNEGNLEYPTCTNG